MKENIFINTARKWDKTAEGRRVQEGRKTRKNVIKVEES